MSLLDDARALVEGSGLDANPRNRLYMVEGAAEVITNLVAEVEQLTAERLKLKGDIDALDTALSHYKKKYLGVRTQVGQISHLSEIVCTWAMEHTNLGEESPEVREAAAQLMEWFDAERVPNHDFFSKESVKMLAEAAEAVRP